MERHFDIAPKKLIPQATQRKASVPLVRPIATSKNHASGNFAPRRKFFSRENISPFLSSMRSLLSRMFRIVRFLYWKIAQFLRKDSFLFQVLRSFRLKWQVKRYRSRVAFRKMSSRYTFLRHPASPFRVLKPSRLALISAVVLGMAMTHVVERLVNGSASADTATEVAGVSAENTPESPKDLSSADLLALVNASGDDEKPFEIEILSQFIDEEKQDKFEAEVRRMVAGYPIESMLPFILEKDRITATFLIGIAKKESNWGRRVPVLDGQDCYNYWGFRERRRLMGTGGHTCFNSKKDAVDSVSKRIENLIYEYERNTPEKMIIWKCGYSCAGHSPESVRKWISDVEGYYNALNDAEKE
ncbi:MAG: hypothetical protein WAU28_00385 [Candidatus Moraniibacteriota bacterium]